MPIFTANTRHQGEEPSRQMMAVLLHCQRKERGRWQKEAGAEDLQFNPVIWAFCLCKQPMSQHTWQQALAARPCSQNGLEIG